MPTNCPTHRPRVTRVKTGCVCCRLRRKKCDERKPVCTGCDRNKLLCSWTSIQSVRRTSHLGWGTPLEFGEHVSRVGVDSSCTPAGPKDGKIGMQHSPQTIPPSGKPVIPPTEKDTTSMMHTSLTLGPRFSEMFSTASLKDPASRILFEHYIDNTSHLLSVIRGPENPFIICVLPLAQADSMIMDSVLAVSGAHLCHASSGSDIKLASSTHYALLLRQFKHSLTQMVSGTDLNGKVLKPVNLLLAALMLCQFEALSGNTHGAVFHHLRACSEFVRFMLTSGAGQGGHELNGFLLELYGYLASVVNITANTDWDYHSVIFDPYTHALEAYRDSKMYGSMFGCAQELIELIPSICTLGYRRLHQESDKDYSFEATTLYESLESKIQKWRAPQSASNDELIGAKIYQQAILIFLHASFYGTKFYDPILLSLLDTTIEPLFEFIHAMTEDSPIKTTMLWPCMVIGSCILNPEHRTFIRHLMLGSQYNMLITSRALQILEWLWEEDPSYAYGPYGLGLVMKKHNITHCMS